MSVKLVKPQPNPATAERINEVLQWADAAARSFAPAVERACGEVGRSLRPLKRDGSA
jgi:hypothetical protein